MNWATRPARPMSEVDMGTRLIRPVGGWGSFHEELSTKGNLLNGVLSTRRAKEH